MYTIESLKTINTGYDRDHRLTQEDVDKANKYVNIIHRSRTDKQIQVGDIIDFTTKHGDYYRNAHVEKYEFENNTWSVCEQPYIPFININDNNDISFSTSGGAWSCVPNNLKLIGKRNKYFKDWGHRGACANGSINFQAEVNVWEYKEDNPLYGEYTTKEWEKHYISYCVDENDNPKNGSQYRYFGNGIAFTTKSDYQAWLDTFRAVEFKGNWPNQTVVFCYKENSHLISKEEWNILDMQMDSRLCNGVNLCKVKYDDENHCIDVYRFSNSSSFDWQRFKEYELARGGDLSKEIL